MKRKWTRYILRVVVFLLILAGSAFALRQFRRTRAAADLPVATAKRGEFLVLVRCRGELNLHSPFRCLTAAGSRPSGRSCRG